MSIKPDCTTPEQGWADQHHYIVNFLIAIQILAEDMNHQDKLECEHEISEYRAMLLGYLHLVWQRMAKQGFTEDAKKMRRLFNLIVKLDPVNIETHHKIVEKLKELDPFFPNEKNVKKPEWIEKFKLFSLGRIDALMERYSLLEAARCIVIDYFMMMVPKHAGFDSSNRFQVPESLSTTLSCESPSPNFEIRLELRANIEFHLWIESHIPDGITDRNDLGISAHIMDTGFDVFWKKAVNLMCRVFDGKIIFPEISILGNSREWLEYRN